MGEEKKRKQKKYITKNTLKLYSPHVWYCQKKFRQISTKPF